MKMDEYQDFAMRTAKILPSLLENLNHGALGLQSELGEFGLSAVQAWMHLPFQADNFPEELGDACWYCALLCHFLDIRFEDLIQDPETLSTMSQELAICVVNRNAPGMVLCAVHFAGEVATCVKAALIYGKPLDRDLLIKNLTCVVNTIALLSDAHQIPFVQATLLGNINKLAKRYPDKYTDDAALARADKIVVLQ